MNAFVKKNQWSDNALENYFLELVVQKKVIDREIQEVLDVVVKSTLHSEYKMLIKRTLFGSENLYFENWGTLQDGLMDAIKIWEIRAKHSQQHWLILDIIVKLVESVFDIPDESMYSFILLEQRGGVENTLIALMKRMLDHLEVGLTELIMRSPHLENKTENGLHSEFLMLQKDLSSFPNLFFETEKDRIASLKHNVQDIYQKFIVEKNSHSSFSVNFSE